MNSIRQSIISVLFGEEHNAKSISKILRISEKEVYEHLEHISRSLTAQNKKLSITPAVCPECGYAFDISTTILNTGQSLPHKDLLIRPIL